MNMTDEPSTSKGIIKNPRGENCEKWSKFKAMVLSNARLCEILDRPAIKPLVFIVCKMYTFIFMGWCLVPFVMLKFAKYWHMFQTVYFMGFIVFLPWPIYKHLVRVFFIRSGRRTQHSRVD